MDVLDRILSNLKEQQQCMLADDLQRLSELVSEQELLWVECETQLAVCVRDAGARDKLTELRALVETNQLLARQSLVFARRVLSALIGDDAYSDSAEKLVRPGKNLDLRA